jgi:hypothetical protein
MCFFFFFFFHSSIRSVTSDQIRDEMIRLGIKYQLVSAHTSFIAVQNDQVVAMQDVSPTMVPQSTRPTHGSQSALIARSQAEIDEIVGIMRANVANVLERGACLDVLEERTQWSEGFYTAHASRFKRRDRWNRVLRVVGIALAAPLVIIGYPFYKLFTCVRECLRKRERTRANAAYQANTPQRDQPHDADVSVR